MFNIVEGIRVGGGSSELVGCPYCKSFCQKKRNCMAYICFRCGKYVSRKDFLFLKDIDVVDGKIVSDKPKISEGKRKLHEHMERRAQEYSERVKRGEIPYNDPNKK